MDVDTIQMFGIAKIVESDIGTLSSSTGYHPMVDNSQVISVGMSALASDTWKVYGVELLADQGDLKKHVAFPTEIIDPMADAVVDSDKSTTATILEGVNDPALSLS